MRKLALVVAAAAAVVMAAPLFGATAATAQGVDVRIGDSPRSQQPRSQSPGVTVGPEGVTVGQKRNCKTVTTTEWRDGRKVTRTEERCR